MVGAGAIHNAELLEKPAEEGRQVTGESKRLDKAIIEAEQMLGTLAAQLFPILMPEYDTEKSEGVPEEHLVPIADGIRDFRYRVQNMTRRMADLIDRQQI